MAFIKHTFNFLILACFYLINIIKALINPEILALLVTISIRYQYLMLKQLYDNF